MLLMNIKNGSILSISSLWEKVLGRRLSVFQNILSSLWNGEWMAVFRDAQLFMSFYSPPILQHGLRAPCATCQGLEEARPGAGAAQLGMARCHVEG